MCTRKLELLRKNSRYYIWGIIDLMEIISSHPLTLQIKKLNHKDLELVYGIVRPKLLIFLFAILIYHADLLPQVKSCSPLLCGSKFPIDMSICGPSVPKYQCYKTRVLIRNSRET